MGPHFWQRGARPAGAGLVVWGWRLEWVAQEARAGKHVRSARARRAQVRHPPDGAFRGSGLLASALVAGAAAFAA